MNIGKTGEAGQAPATQRSGSGAGVRPAASGPVSSGQSAIDAGSAADNVTLSDTSRSMIAGRHGQAEIRTAKVAELKLAIDEGRYKPDAGRIADRLLDEAVELQSRRRPGS